MQARPPMQHAMLDEAFMRLMGRSFAPSENAAVASSAFK
jgi:hypothetical protein